MLFLPGPDFQQRATSWTGAPSSTLGVTVTSGASNADGATATLLSALAFDAQYIEIFAHNNNASGTATDTLLDIGYDPAGGTSWNDLILSLPAGYLSANALAGNSWGGRSWRFPLFIPAGSTILGRGRNVTGSTRAISVNVVVQGSPRNPSQWRTGTSATAFGAVRASSGGTAITPSTSTNTFGSWTDIGSTLDADYFYFQLSTMGPANATVTQRAQAVQFGIDGTNVLEGPFYYGLSSSEICTELYPMAAFWRTLPYGTQLKLQTKDSGATGQASQFIIHAVR